jgi:hypothetical protein
MRAAGAAAAPRSAPAVADTRAHRRIATSLTSARNGRRPRTGGR